MAAIVMLAGCQTPYQDMGLLGGVSASQIDGTTIQIVARGNGYTDPSTIQKYVLLKAAEETVKHGFDTFAIASDADGTRAGMATFASATANNNSIWGSSFSMPIIKPGQDLMIKMFKGPKPENAPPNVYDAHEVMKYLGPQVKRG